MDMGSNGGLGVLKGLGSLRKAVYIDNGFKGLKLANVDWDSLPFTWL
jgi:hypothetical protein